MKKIFFAVIILIAGTVTAQEFEFGAKAGLNFATLEGDGFEDLDSRTGFLVGLVAELPVSKRFSVQPELLYSGQGATASGDRTFKLDYVSLPLMGKIYIAEGLSVEVGPQVGINVVSKEEHESEKKEIQDIETLEFAGALGAGYRFPGNLFFQARYIWGLNPAWEVQELKNRVFQLSAGYKF